MHNPDWEKPMNPDAPLPFDLGGFIEARGGGRTQKDDQKDAKSDADDEKKDDDAKDTPET